MFRKLDLLISHLERLIIGFGLITMTALIFVNVALRFFVDKTIVWAEDIAIILMICITFFGAAYGTRLNRHITMSALYDTLSGRFRKTLYILSLILSACLSVLLVILGLEVTRTIYDMKGVITSMGIPKYWPYLVVVLALLFMAVHFIQLTARFFKTGEVDSVLEHEE